MSFGSKLRYALAAAILHCGAAMAETPAGSEAPPPAAAQQGSAVAPPKSPLTPNAPARSAPHASAPAWPRAESPYQLSLYIDVPLPVVASLLWALPYMLLTPELQPPFCDPCNRENVNSFDRLTISWHSPWASTAANYLLAALAPFFITLELVDYGPGNWRGYLTDTMVVGESVVLSGLLNEFIRRAVHRPRPYMYEAGVYPQSRTSEEAWNSFYSGHAAAAFAFAVSLSYGFQIRHPNSPWRYVMWIGTLTYAAFQASLRVASGDHFPTDVLAGAVVGSAIGILVPVLHRRPFASLPSLTLIPVVTPEQASFALSGAF